MSSPSPRKKRAASESPHEGLSEARSREGDASSTNETSGVAAPVGAVAERSSANQRSEAKLTLKPKRTKRSHGSGRGKRPGRPLSAYNLFFRDERQRLIDAEADIQAIYEEEVAPTATAKRPTDKFQTLVKVVSRRWNMLPKEDRKPYEAMAKVEMEDYQERLREYHEEEDDEEEKAAAASQTSSESRRLPAGAFAPREEAGNLQQAPGASVVLGQEQANTLPMSDLQRLFGVGGATSGDLTVAAPATATAQFPTVLGVIGAGPFGAAASIGGAASLGGAPLPSLLVQPPVAPNAALPAAFQNPRSDLLLDASDGGGGVGRQQQDLLSTYNRILSAPPDALRQVSAFLDVVKALELRISNSQQTGQDFSSLSSLLPQRPQDQGPQNTDVDSDASRRQAADQLRGTLQSYTRQAPSSQAEQLTQAIAQNMLDISAGSDNSILHASLVTLAKQQQGQEQDQRTTNTLANLTTQQLSNVIAHQHLNQNMPSAAAGAAAPGPSHQAASTATNPSSQGGPVATIDDSLLPLLQRLQQQPPPRR